MADSAGTVTNTYAYTAFGELFSQTGTVANNYLYTGQQFDEQAGLYSLRARYYDPSNGRFNSRDMIGYDIANPVELNRYGYTANNPINFIDPSGNQAFAEYAVNSLKGAGIGATVSFVSDIAVQVFIDHTNRIDWNHALRSAIAGAAAGFVGGIVGTGGISYFGKGLAGVVYTGMLDGWASGMIARGVYNIQNDQSFFDGYSFQAAISDAVVGGLTAGFFYSAGKAIYHFKGRMSMAGQMHPSGVRFDSDGFPIFDSTFDTRLPKKLLLATDRAQFKYATSQLARAIESDSGLAAQFTDQQLQLISKGKTPTGYLWHHNQRTGVL